MNAKVTNIFPLVGCGVEVTVKLPNFMGGGERTTTFPNMTGDEFMNCYKAWQAGGLVQNAFPMLNADQREFLMTGLTPEQWDKLYDE
jgi:hypothetical protein